MAAGDTEVVQSSILRRVALYLGPEDVIAPARELLSAQEWILLPFRHIDEVSAALRKQQPSVGILVLQDVDAVKWQKHLLRLIAQNENIRWLALVEKELLNQLAIRQLIGSAFYDYHTTPIDPQRFLVMLGHAAGMAEISREALFTSDVNSATTEEQMVGASKQMQKVYQDIRKVAATDAPVLITGESGTGKELTARAIHERSFRKDGPFVAVNCGALPANLIQSELFGHEKGAFTGATERKIGRIEAANGGTLFLDEIGDLPLDLQVNLLRFLQEQTIHRVGGKDEIRVDVRVLAATHVNLEEAIKGGRFRQDLYYRLNVLQILMPPLRAREGDIPLLANYVFHRFADERGQRVKGFSEDALQIMNSYSWPGNIRELINRVRRAMVMCDKILINAEDLGLERRQNQRARVSLSEARDAAERDAIKAAVAQSLGSITRAAELLQISRVSLYRLMEKHGITPPGQKDR
ncbi:sigma 54-interacting transcriptional regulator [Acidithiobacillus sp. AMEEHan]|uniref:sigma-54 dependent transcriptional regulator n=1 Tax=Acidithiobacillus sp. AMEEHan TaxID=2994951 RepID=UPI0027E400E7|nr:sigma 54-interacting transcriptional regulator [Acidithiobacillus sp. AMEEHan]